MLHLGAILEIYVFFFFTELMYVCFRMTHCMYESGARTSDTTDTFNLTNKGNILEWLAELSAYFLVRSGRYFSWRVGTLFLGIIHTSLAVTIACGSLPPRKCNYALHKYDAKTEMVELLENIAPALIINFLSFVDILALFYAKGHIKEARLIQNI